MLLAFPTTPRFSSCGAALAACARSWALRIVDAANIYLLGAALSSAARLQQSTFYVEHSTNLWIYNLDTIGAAEMISPLNGKPIPAAPSRNGSTSSLLAWLGGANQTAGSRAFAGYRLFTLDSLHSMPFSPTCKSALTRVINCADDTRA